MICIYSAKYIFLSTTLIYKINYRWTLCTIYLFILYAYFIVQYIDLDFRSIRYIKSILLILLLYPIIELVVMTDGIVFCEHVGI